MNLNNKEFVIVAISPNSAGSSQTFTKAVKAARLDLNWSRLPPDQNDANITVYLCHHLTRIDPITGALTFPPTQKPFLIDNIKTHRPSRGRRN